MKFKLLSLYFLTLAFCLFSGCESDNPEKSASANGAEVTFAVSDLSRAADASTLDKFAVFGDMKLTANSSDVPTTVFNNTLVVKENDVWHYEGTQYWFPLHEHSFVAVYPPSAVKTDIAPAYTNSCLSFTYTLPTADDAAVSHYHDIDDILTATHRRAYNEGDDNTTTTFRFSHIMSKINISAVFDDNVRDKDEYIEFTGVELSGVSSKATFNITPSPRLSNSQTDDRVIDCTTNPGTANLTITFDEPVKVYNDQTTVTLFADDDTIIMLPQAFAADSDAKITLFYSVKGSSEIRKSEFPLMSQDWGINKSYNYKFAIYRTGPVFEQLTIADWNPVNGGEIIVD